MKEKKEASDAAAASGQENEEPKAAAKEVDHVPETADILAAEEDEDVIF